MPGRDGTGPFGGGTGGGRGMGRGAGKGRLGGNCAGAGPGGNCFCPVCGATLAHQVGVPCASMNCPKCGTRMVRE